MSIDPTTLRRNTIVETTADHFANGRTCLTNVADVIIRGDLTILRAFVPVPDGMAIDDAERALSLAHPDRALEAAIEDAVPEGEWDGRTTLANLRAAGFDVVKATR
jgi:hypothetical protein